MKSKVINTAKKRFISILLLQATLGFCFIFFNNCSGFKSTYQPNGTNEFASSNVDPLLNGKTLYTTNCVGCHGSISSSTKKDISVTRLNSAINEVTAMSFLKGRFSETEIEQIVLALKTPALPVDSNWTSSFACNINNQDSAVSNPLKRLTSRQYLNTLKSIFGTTAVNEISGLISIHPSDQIQSKAPVYMGNISKEFVNSAFNIADQISTKVSQNSGYLQYIGLGNACSTSPTMTCIKTFITQFGRKVLRKKLSTSEIDDFYTNYYLLGTTNTEKVKSLIMGLLLQPEHQFIFEVGNDTVISNYVQLSQYEIASRLSFQLLGDSPDEELLNAAENNLLTTNSEIQNQIDRLTAKPQFKETILSFLNFWLLAGHKTGYPLGLPQSFFNDAELGNQSNRYDLTNLINDDAADFFLGILNDKLSYSDLMSLQVAYPKSSAAAKVYGLSPAQTSGAKVAVNHAGLFQRPAFMLTSSGNSSPIMRGLFIFKEVMCNEIGLPADTSAINSIPDLDPVYYGSRAQVQNKTSSASCTGCHSQFNHFGFALEAYDGLGRFRVQESYFIGESINNYRTNCNPSDTSIVGYNNPASLNYCPPIKPPYIHSIQWNLSPTLDSNKGPIAVQSASEFAKAIADSNTVSSCFTKNWRRFLKLQIETEENNCELQQIQTNTRSPANLSNALFESLKSNRFKIRKVE